MVENIIFEITPQISGERLKRSVRADAVISSSLLRAVQTAEILGQELGIGPRNCQAALLLQSQNARRESPNRSSVRDRKHIFCSALRQPAEAGISPVKHLTAVLPARKREILLEIPAALHWDWSRSAAWQLRGRSKTAV